MKQANKTRGSIIIASMLVALVVALICGSFVVSVLQEYKLSLRSLKANTALNLAEAGVDAAMYDLKQKTVGTAPWQSATDNNGNLYYYRTVLSSQSLGSGDVGTVKVIIDAPNSQTPTIISQAKVTHNGDSSSAIIKQVKVVLTGSTGGGVAGVYSKQTINMNGQNVVFDAYDSSVGAYGGNNILDQVTVAVLDPSASINLNKDTVYGKLAFVGTSSQGAANNYSDRINWQYDNGNGGALYGAQTVITHNNNGSITAVFDKSRVVPNMPVPTFNIPTKPDPATNTIIPIAPPNTNDVMTLGYAGASTPTIYAVKVSANEMNNNNVNLSGTTTINIVGPVILVIDGALSINGNSAGINIANTGGASLTLFVKNNINIAGKGIANSNWDARTFKLIPTGDSGQNISLGGNGDYRGMFLGPTFNANINGNGAWYGAILANAVSIVGNGGFHYDVQCGNANGGGTGFSVKQWIELTNVPGTTYARDTRSVLN